MEIKLPSVHLRPLSKESEFIEKRFASEQALKSFRKVFKKKAYFSLQVRKCNVSLRPLSRVVPYWKRRKNSFRIMKLSSCVIEKQTYICVRFRINEVFKEASSLVDFYKRSLTWCSSPESSSEDSFKNPLSPRKVVSYPSTDEMLDSLRFSTDWTFYNGEFDPGSGWTLAAGLTHASRGVTGRSLLLRWRPAHGCVTRMQPTSYWGIAQRNLD